jgi:hypothetical protein
LEEEVKGPKHNHPAVNKQNGAYAKKMKSESSEEDDNFEEPEEQRAIPQFLVNLPGVTATDSMGYRIEALRVYLEN